MYNHAQWQCCMWTHIPVARVQLCAYVLQITNNLLGKQKANLMNLSLIISFTIKCNIVTRPESVQMIFVPIITWSLRNVRIMGIYMLQTELCFIQLYFNKFYIQQMNGTSSYRKWYTSGWMSMHGRGSWKSAKNYNQTDWTHGSQLQSYGEHNKTRQTVDFILDEIKWKKVVSIFSSLSLSAYTPSL